MAPPRAVESGRTRWWWSERIWAQLGVYRAHLNGDDDDAAMNCSTSWCVGISVDGRDWKRHPTGFCLLMWVEASLLWDHQPPTCFWCRQHFITGCVRSKQSSHSALQSTTWLSPFILWAFFFIFYCSTNLAFKIECNMLFPFICMTVGWQGVFAEWCNLSPDA